MVTFDSHEDGTAAAAWDDAVAALPPLSLGTADELVVVAAHPDDETLGAGGLIAAFAARGLPVSVIVVTDGAADGTPGIARRRSAEVRDAVAALAPLAAISELGHPDGGTLETRDAIERDLARALRDVSRGALIATCWPDDGHRDHRVVGEAVVEVADGRRVIGFPIWRWHWGDPASDESMRGVRALAVDAEAKARALRAFTSQTEGGDPMLRESFLEHFRRPVEVFVELSGEPGDEDEGGSDDPLDVEYFEEIHTRRADPWGFTTRWYEERKRAITTASLPRARYATALEVGCSIGVLTSELAPRCDDLLAVDISAAAVDRARERVGSAARVEVVDAAADFPAGPFELIVLSEVGYYLTSDALDGLLRSAVRELAPGGDLILCHWRHPVDDYPLGGDEVHARMAAVPGPQLIGRHIEPDFLLDVYSLDGRSIAARDGLS